MSRFYFGGSDSESNGEEDALPYPKPLARSAFLTPDFSPTAFLSSLSNRHQTLEDLRTELRARNQELNKELLDLVNENYQDFLGLGSSLTGGDEKIEEVRVGLLSFRRDIEGLKVQVIERREEVAALLEEKKQVAARIREAKGLVEIDARLEELERALALRKDQSLEFEDADSVSISDSEDSDEESLGGTVSVSRLRRRIEQFMSVRRLMEKVGPANAFLELQDGRVRKIRETLLLDLSGALLESKRTGNPGSRALNILGLYRILEEPREAVKAVRKQKA